MPTYEIEQFELHCMKYQVEAASEAEAIAKLFQGEAEPVEQSQDFIEVAKDFGLPAEEHRELADALRNQGISVDEVIPSIRSIQKVRRRGRKG
jgi:type III secretion system FlhB-like substrate exporter